MSYRWKRVERQQVKWNWNLKGGDHLWLDAVGFVQCISIHSRRAELHTDEVGR